MSESYVVKPGEIILVSSRDWQVKAPDYGDPVLARVIAVSAQGIRYGEFGSEEVPETSWQQFIAWDRIKTLEIAPAGVNERALIHRHWEWKMKLAQFRFIQTRHKGDVD
jgi:hypothetical protein